MCFAERSVGVQGRFTVVSCQRVSTSKYHTLGNKALRGRIFPTWTLFFLAENRENTFKAGKSSLTRQELDQHSLEEILFRELIASLSVVSVRFGSVSVSSICYRPGSVHVRFRFLRFLVDFASVRFGSVFGTFCIDICFFFRRRKGKYRLLPATGFMSSGFQRAERAELGKPKLPDIVNACNLFSWNLLFSLNSKSNYNLSNQFTWRAPGTYRLIS